jgi:hypothetical protein
MMDRTRIRLLVLVIAHVAATFALGLKQAYPDCIFGMCRGRLRARSFSASGHRPRSPGSDFGLTFDDFFLG